MNLVDLSRELKERGNWESTPNSQPLSGTRVLDLSRVLAGPLCTMILGDLGADVIKVERPGTGDETRSWGPPFHGEDAAYYFAVNRNRRSMTLNIAKPMGYLILSRLVWHADIVVENFLPEQFGRLQLDDLQRNHSDTVWISIRGAGGAGSLGGLPGYDAMAQARSGLMSVTGFPETGPTKTGVAIADVITGLYAAIAALAGLRDHSLRSQGTVIEVPLLECAVSALVNQASNFLIGGDVPGRLGNDHPNVVPYGPFPCSDRVLMIGAGNQRQFENLCKVLDRTDLLATAKFADNASRVINREQLTKELTRSFRSRTSADWLHLLQASGVPCAPLYELNEVFDDKHISEVGLVTSVSHPRGPIRQLQSPLTIDGARPPIRLAPPVLGEHTEEILMDLGLCRASVRELERLGLVSSADTESE